MAQAASFRERVTIYTPASVINDDLGGRMAAGPDTSMETWAAVTQYQAGPVETSEGKFVIKQKHRIVIRYINAPNVQYTNRIDWNGTTITVQSVVIDPRKTTITLHGYGD